MPDDPETTEAPAAVAAGLEQLGTALDAAVPVKELDRNLLIATWNLRAFGGLTKKWVNEPGDSPRRNLADLGYIAEIASRFDVIAVQEVRGDLRALRHLLKALGPDWGVIMTDVTETKEGNNERLAFLFDTRRVKPSGLAGEFAEPFVEETGALAADAVGRQFARTPYAVSFLSGSRTFILVTLHVIYGQDSSARVAELRAIADRLAAFAAEVAQWGHSLIALGDFNIDRQGDPLFDAFTSTGLTPAPQLNDVRRTIFDEAQKRHFYDQVAWFTDPHKGPVLTLSSTAAGTVDFVPVLRGDQTLTELSWKISDHYPLWVEFSTWGKPGFPHVKVSPAF
jgi:endonuclease/exonuclease/phosphatase family metal-dependent hydrolase